MLTAECYAGKMSKFALNILALGVHLPVCSHCYQRQYIKLTAFDFAASLCLLT